MQNFKTDLSNEVMSSREILDKYLFCGEPHIFAGDTGKYSRLKSTIASHFRIEITKVFMVGSAKLGFSIARVKSNWGQVFTFTIPS